MMKEEEQERVERSGEERGREEWWVGGGCEAGGMWSRGLSGAWRKEESGLWKATLRLHNTRAGQLQGDGVGDESI